MTASTIIAAAAVGIFLLLCVVSWYLVQTLKQARLTALAMEKLLVGARPRIEEATERLGSLLGRADRVLASVESGQGAGGNFSGILGIVGRVMSGWTAGSQAVSMISAAMAAIVETWSALTRPKPSAEGTAAMEGAGNE